MTINTEIATFLRDNGLLYSLNGTQLVMDCPFCDKEGHFYMNQENGLFDCKVCGETGNFRSFQREVAGEVKTVESHGECSQDTMQYLTGTRKFTVEAVDYLGVKTDDLGNPAIREDDIKTGEIKRYGIRNIKDIAGKSDWYSVGPKGTINGRALMQDIKTVIICEGHWDVLALLSYDIRFKDMVISMGGCKDNPKDVIERLKHVDKVIICFDNDMPGQDGARALAQKIGIGKCKNVILPKDDVNDCLIAGVPYSEIEKAIENAQEFHLGGSAKAGDLDALDYIFNEEAYNGKKSLFERIDKLINGWRPGELTVLSGLTSVGKTTFSKILMYNFAQQGLPSVIIPYETKPKKIIKDLITSMLGRTPAESTMEEVTEKIQELNALPLYFFKQSEYDGSLGIDELKDWIRGQVDTHGAKFVLVDDLDYVAMNTEYPRDLNGKQTKIMVSLVELARELDVHIILVAHIKKVEDIRRMPTMQDIKGATEITNKPDNVIIVHRDTEAEDEEIKAEVKIHVAKVRDDGETGFVKLSYDVETCTYEED